MKSNEINMVHTPFLAMEDAVLWFLGLKGLAGARLDMGTCRETTSGYALTALWRIGNRSRELSATRRSLDGPF
jgi:hypothetical protein